MMNTIWRLNLFGSFPASVAAITWVITNLAFDQLGELEEVSVREGEGEKERETVVRITLVVVDRFNRKKENSKCYA